MPGFSYREPAARSKSTLLTLRQANGKAEVVEAAVDDNHHGPTTPQTWGRGIVNDIKTTIGTHWREEMTNFNTKTVAVSFFMFIAVIAPCITFGAVYAKRTDNYMGPVELLLATGWCGTFYSLVSGMPMVRFGYESYVVSTNVGMMLLTKCLDDQRWYRAGLDLSSRRVRARQELGYSFLVL
jgi:hypothetical protein